jgi:hypothetical protein
MKKAAPKTDQEEDDLSKPPMFGEVRLSAKFLPDIPFAMQMIDNRNIATALPKGYQPSDFDVICGRGKGSYNKAGNVKFREILLERTSQYGSISSKIGKSIFLNEIIDTVQSQNKGQSFFIRQTTGGFWEKLNDEEVREKVGHAVREVLAPRGKRKLSEFQSTSKITNTVTKSSSKDESFDKKFTHTIQQFDFENSSDTSEAPDSHRLQP